MKPRGFRERLGGYAQELAAGLRRRQARQRPRVRLLWDDGSVRLIPVDSPAGEGMLATAEELIRTLVVDESTEQANGGDGDRFE